MKAVLLILPGVFFFANSGALRDDAAVYTQSYAILIKGAVAGNETVAEKIGDGGSTISTSEHEIFITDGLETKRMAFSTKMVLSKATKAPVSYNYRYTAGNSDSCDVVIKNARITRTLNRGDRTSEITAQFQPNMVIVDFSVYHHYDYLIRKYDANKGGRQVFADFIPIIGNDVPVALTFLGNENLESRNGRLPVRNFAVEFVGIWAGSLSADKDGRLVRLVIPAQDLLVVREDLLNSNDAKAMPAAKTAD